MGRTVRAGTRRTRRFLLFLRPVQESARAEMPVQATHRMGLPVMRRSAGSPCPAAWPYRRGHRRQSFFSARLPRTAVHHRRPSAPAPPERQGRPRTDRQRPATAPHPQDCGNHLSHRLPRLVRDKKHLTTH